MENCFRSYLNALEYHSKAHETALIKDCELCFNAKQVDQSYSSGSTFFIGANDTPSCTLERLALDIYHQHTTSNLFISSSSDDIDAKISGAEWWTLRIDSRDDVGFHWDRDYGLEENGVLKYPNIASVTYVSNAGGSTIITSLAGKVGNAVNIDGESFSSYAVSKLLGSKHIAFRGDLLHGAPSNVYEDISTSEDSEASSSENESQGDDSVNALFRITFLVNIWINHRPIQPKRLPKRLSNKLSHLGQNDVSMSFQELSKANEFSIPRILAASSSDQVYTAELVQDSNSYRLSLTLPEESVFTAQMLKADVLVVRAVEENTIGSICLTECGDSTSDEEDYSRVVQPTKKQRVASK